MTLIVLSCLELHWVHRLRVSVSMSHVVVGDSFESGIRRQNCVLSGWDESSKLKSSREYGGTFFIGLWGQGWD